MGLLVLCVTALLFGVIHGEGMNPEAQVAPKNQPIAKSLLELLKKDARELAEIVKYHDNELNADGDKTDQSGGPGVEEIKRDIGTSTPTGICTETTGGGVTPLCKECYYYRRLPDGYFPKYLNERKCQAERCLNGNGVCLQQHTKANVQQNGRTYTLDLASGCKCGIRQGDAMDSYIP
ncbi:prothoracicotropic hormone-like [Branchiostoma lanceolatum]|uniref:prothoracicotropic hormone-like n=1 Tax=Branchiostoma lanceolatum TaxID=7740 RepID=UPI00345244F9